MTVLNAELAAKLRQLADLLEIEGENPFRVRAYRNAATTVETLSRGVAQMVAAGEDLRALPGIGAAIAAKLQEMVTTGHLTALEKEEKKLPATLTDLMRIPAIGPKRVHLLYEKLNIATRDDLEQALRAGRIRTLAGFGEKTEQKLLAFLEQKQAADTRTPWSTAEQVVAPLLEHLREAPGVGEVMAAGSYRRRRETVGDVDLLAASTAGDAVVQRFVTHPAAGTVLAAGGTKASVRMHLGLQVDLRIVPPESFGAALHYFTGSKEHNIAVRTRGVKAGLRINEYGVYRGRQRVCGLTEREVFESVGLAYIEPELRENRGEIEAAEKGALPTLVRVEDMRGDLHGHTEASDGRLSLEELAAAAQARGYSYIAVTDHSKRVTIAHGLNATRLARQIREIDRVNERLSGIRLLKSAEVDILEDGSLDLGDDILRELDIVVCSVHYGSAFSREKQTERILRAMDNPLMDILAHPTGRLIGERLPIAVDLERVLRGARERGCYVEVNAQPSRLDLDDVHCRLAKEIGLKIAISTDSHRESELDFMRLGVAQARRGWLEPADILNARPWDELRRLLRRAT